MSFPIPLLLQLLCALLLTLSPLGRAFADPASAVVTIAEGQVQIVRAVSRSPATAGVKVRAGDILMVDGTGYLRVETADGVRVDLGPGTRALWLPKPAGKAPARLLNLRSGLIKLSAPATRGATPVAFTSPVIEVDEAAVVVLSQEAERVSVFAETGALKGRERAAPGGAESPLALKSGEFLSRPNDKKGALSPRPSAEFIGQLPRPFLDSLPARHADFAKRDVVLKPGTPVSYEDAAPWLQGDAPLRQELMARWRSRASDPAFKAALVTNMKLHPEWERVLFPERFRPPVPVAAGQDRGAAALPYK